MEAVLRTRSVDEWVAALTAAGVPASPINTVDRALEDPQVAALGMVCEVPHPTLGRVRLTAPHIEFGGARPAVRRPPPLLGQHTAEVLQAWLGLDPSAIERLQAAGVVALG